MLKLMFVFAALAGCAVDSSPEVVTYERTIVTIGAAGPTISTETVTADQQREEVAARDEARANPDAISPYVQVSGCWNGGALWMYDQPNYTGNQLCVIDPGWDSLANYWRSTCSGMTCFVGTWSGAIRSYYGGEQDFYFAVQDNGTWNYTPLFNQYSHETVADGLTPRATVFGLVDHHYY